MSEQTRFEQFPAWMVAVSLAHALSIDALGVYILAGAGPVWAAAYAALCVGLEINLLRTGCRDCYYYGKRCAFGRGIVCARFFARGEPRRFSEKCATWRDFVPDILVGLVPVVAAVVLSVVAFSWTRLAAVLALVALSSVGNAFVRGSIACRHCIQRDLGCPAQKLFAGAAATPGSGA